MRDISRYIAVVILYASTLYGATNHVLLLIIPLIIFNFNSIEIPEKNKESFLLILLISIISVLNNVGFTVSTGTVPNIPYIPLMILCFFFVQFLNDKVMTFLLILIAIEVFVAGAEYALGISTFFTGSENYTVFSNAALYYRKVAGLSDSSSVLSYKVLIGLFITHLLPLNSTYKKMLYGIMLAGIVFSFNRTVIISGLLFLFFINIGYIKEQARKPIVFIAILVVSLFVAIFVLPAAVDYLIAQLSRGDASRGVDLSFRDLIWKEYFIIIKDSPIFGFGSYKVFVEILATGYEGVSFHAHNSVIMSLATQGFVITLLNFILIAINVTSKNILYIVSIFIYSMAQYGVFWGISFLDVILFYFLFSSSFHQDKNNHFPVRSNVTDVCR